MSIRVVVADQQTLVRIGFRLLVDSAPTVPGTCGQSPIDQWWALKEGVHLWRT